MSGSPEDKIYCIMHPEPLCFLLCDGELFAVNTVDEFNSGVAARYPDLVKRVGRHIHATISEEFGGWRNTQPADRADALTFTNRRDGPELLPARDWQDRPALDIFQSGLLLTLGALAIKRNVPVWRLEWLFEPDNPTLDAAREFLAGRPTLQ